MIVVVADTSPLNYLILIDQIDLLRRLYGRVLIPDAVSAELRSEVAPQAVAQWASRMPAWIEVVSAPPSGEQALNALDNGEREAILLAEASRVSLLVMDERKGTLVARARGLETVGTLGILARAHKRGWVDAKALFKTLIQTTSFRSTGALRDRFLASLEEP
jgi:predicted nucleic acid-binding protein